MKYLIIKHLNMKKLMIILSALALTFGAYSCTKTPENPGKPDETSQDPSEEPVVSEDPSESPDDKLSITEIHNVAKVHRYILFAANFQKPCSAIISTI